ncbi:hypothetical protein N0Y54_42695 [Nostoc punctiforme UO1]
MVENSNFLRDWLKYIKLPSRRATKRKKGNWDTGNEERAIAPTTAATIAYSPFNLLTWLFGHSPHLRGLFLILGGS